MEIKTLEQQKEFLGKNLDKINTVVSAYIGARVNLKVIEKTTIRETYLKLEDNHNFAKCCGIMSRAWKEVIIDTFGIWWTEYGCEMSMHFSYEHINGGHNGAEFCVLIVEEDFVTIK